MEVKEKSKKRELIKTIAIIFLVILLLLTFFSNTIMNRSLPEVATQSIVSGTINAKIRGSGTVSANESYEVNLKQTRTVHSICVKVGDAVEQGDLLFVLEDGDSEELKAAQDQLAVAQINYQKQLLNLSKEYESEDRNVAQLKKELERAKEQLDANYVTDSEIAYAKGDLATAQTQLEQLQMILDQLNETLSENAQYTAAKEAVDKWKAEAETAKTKMDEAEKQLAEGQFNDPATLQADLEKKKGIAKDAETAMTTAQNALNDAMGIVTNDTTPSTQGAVYLEITARAEAKMLEAGVDATVESNRDTYVRIIVSTDYSDKKEEYQKAYENVRKAQLDYDMAITKFNSATADVRSAEELYNAALSGQNTAALLQQKFNDAQTAYAIANQNYQQANMNLMNAEAGVANLKSQIKAYEANKKAQEAAISDRTKAVADLEAKKTAYDTAVTTVEAKEQALADALSGKDIDKQLDDLDLKATRLELEKLKDQVDKLKTDTVSTEVTAPVAGTISAINVSAGKEASPGVPMATIDVTDRGYTVKISVTNDQAKQIKVGDTANVTNYYWGSELEAVVEAITPDPSNPGKGKMVVFRVKGDVDPGTNITLSIGQRSSSFDTVVPKSALRSDANGDFVLVITEKSTPLGPRYIATRADVQILAQDDTSAAVSGLVSGDFVITTSSRPLSAGTQVRLVETQ